MRAHRAITSLSLTMGLAVSACGASSESTLRPEQWRSRLRDAMGEPVPTRDKREELSRVLAESVENGELERMTRPEIRAAFGEGMSCDALPLCGEQGFFGSDWYYLIGSDPDPKIKQLPVLIVGFDTHDRVSRVYTLTTH